MRRGMNSMEMQKNNRILVFKTLQEKGMMTRAELAVELNLQKATITNIINEFFEMGIVEVNGETAAGRRDEKLNLKLDDIYTMSIGITRKDYQLAIFDLSGNMIKHSCCNFQKENGFREIVENLKADAVKMANEYGNNRILGICLAVPGLFINRPEKNEEIFMVSEFEELSQINVKAELEKALGRKVMIKHDAKLSAYAEWRCAEEIKGQERGSLVVVRSRGFGIGTGCVVNGNIMNGHLGLAGEGGYMGINYNQARGNKGTFEYCAGSESAARYVKERLFEFPDTILNEKSTYLEVFDAYRKGDALATWAVHKVAWMLGYGIANIIYLINPDCIIIGPDYPDTKDFVNKIREAIRNFVPAFVEENASIRYSKISQDSFLLGGFYYTFDNLCRRDNIFDLIRSAKGARWKPA
ncbi:MAG: ROK family transcriptional regulator [Blautia faecis]